MAWSVPPILSKRTSQLTVRHQGKDALYGLSPTPKGVSLAADHGMGGSGSLGQCPCSWPVTAMTHENEVKAVLRNLGSDVIEGWDMWNTIVK